jgi:hypothetical protein
LAISSGSVRATRCAMPSIRCRPAAWTYTTTPCPIRWRSAPLRARSPCTRCRSGPGHSAARSWSASFTSM